MNACVDVICWFYVNFSAFKYDFFSRKRYENCSFSYLVCIELAIHEPKSFAGVLEFAKSKSAEAKSKQGLASIL